MSCWNSYDVISSVTQERSRIRTRGNESFTGGCASLGIWCSCNGGGGVNVENAGVMMEARPWLKVELRLVA